MCVCSIFIFFSSFRKNPLSGSSIQLTGVYCTLWAILVWPVSSFVSDLPTHEKSTCSFHGACYTRAVVPIQNVEQRANNTPTTSIYILRLLLNQSRNNHGKENEIENNNISSSNNNRDRITQKHDQINATCASP